MKDLISAGLEKLPVAVFKSTTLTILSDLGWTVVILATKEAEIEKKYQDHTPYKKI